MSRLNWSRFVPTSRSPSQLSQWPFVVISTAQFDHETSPRKSNYWLLRCVGPEQRGYRNSCLRPMKLM